MTIPKAKAAKQQTKQGVLRNLEYEQRVREIMEEAARVKQQAMEEAARRKQQALEQAANLRRKEENREKIRPAQLARQRNMLLRKSIEAAGKGMLLIPIDKIEDTVKSELRELGFRIATKSDDQRLLEGGLTKRWNRLWQPSTTGFSVLLEPLKKFLMISIVNAWRSRQNDLENIRTIAKTLLSNYYIDLECRDYTSLWYRLDRLQQLNSSVRYAAIQMKDLMLNQSECSRARTLLGAQVLEISINSKNEQEFFQVIATAMEILYPVAHEESIQADLEEKAELIADQANEELSSVADNHLTLSWWDSHYFEGILPSKYSQRVYWLASEFGQQYLERIEKIIRKSANSGSHKAEFEIYKKSDEFRSIEIVERYLELQGYEVTLSEEGDTEATMSIAWN